MTKDNKFIGAVKVGPKGQIVIPKELRDMFGINPGDALVILADPEKGIALERMSVFSGIADMILSGRSSELYPEMDEVHKTDFANAIKEVEHESDQD